MPPYGRRVVETAVGVSPGDGETAGVGHCNSIEERSQGRERRLHLRPYQSNRSSGACGAVVEMRGLITKELTLICESAKPWQKTVCGFWGFEIWTEWKTKEKSQDREIMGSVFQEN